MSRAFLDLVSRCLALLLVPGIAVGAAPATAPTPAPTPAPMPIARDPGVTPPRLLIPGLGATLRGKPGLGLQEAG